MFNGIRVIDGHAHIFPEIIALKASENIGNFYGIKMKYDGTVDCLLDEGTKAGVDQFLVHSVATTPKQVQSINTFISDAVSKYPDRFIGFATLHPDSENLEEEFNYAMEKGLHGIKLHPDFQKFDIDSQKAKAIYSLAEGRCPILIHMGDKRTQYSKGEKLAKVLKEFKNLKVIAAHFGGYSEWSTGAAYLAGTGVYVDTSSSMFALPPYQVRQLIDIYTPERVIFGTDYPMWNAADELNYIKNLDLTDSERELILHGNLEGLLSEF